MTPAHRVWLAPQALQEPREIREPLGLLVRKALLVLLDRLERTAPQARLALRALLRLAM